MDVPGFDGTLLNAFKEGSGVKSLALTRRHLKLVQSICLPMSLSEINSAAGPLADPSKLSTSLVEHVKATNPLGLNSR